MLSRRIASPVVFAIGAAIIISAVFYDVLLGLGTFVIRDYSIFAYPLAQYHRESFWNGEIPLWNPYNNCGIPFLAQWSTLVLYPGSLIYLILPLPWSLGVYCLVHLWFGCFGMYLLARRWAGNGLGAAIAALAFGFNGFVQNCLSWPAFLASMMWIPWVVLLVSESWSGDRRKFGWAALAGAMQMLTGGPEVIFLTWLVIGCLWLADLAREKADRKRMMLTLPLMVLMVSILAAAQLLPFFDLLSASQRSAGYADSTWSMPKWGWANLLVPLFRFYRAPNGVFFQTGQDWTSSYYLGIGVLFLAITAIVFVRRFHVWLLAALSVITLLLALGDSTFVYPTMRKIFPQLGFMRFPIKFVLFPAFAFPLLAGFGLNWMIEAREKTPGLFRRWMLALGGVLVLSIVGITFYGKSNLLPNETWDALRNSGLSRVLFIVLVMAALFGLGLEERKQDISIAFLLALFLLDPLTHAPSQNPRVRLSVYEPGISAREMSPAPKLGESRAMMTRARHDRIYGSMLKDPVADYFGRRVTLFGNSSLIDRIPNVDGFFSLYLGRPREAWSALFFNSDTNATKGLADFMGVSHVSDRENILGWAHREGAMPVVTVGQRPVAMEDAQVLKIISTAEFRPREVVYLDPLEPMRELQSSKAPNATVSVVQVASSSVNAIVDSDASTVAVVSQAFDKKWKAFLDDKPVPILRANYAFQAVEVPVGRHRLTLKYEDRSFWFGAGCSMGGLIIAAGLIRSGSNQAREE